jgi:hypothetical protein
MASLTDFILKISGMGQEPLLWKRVHSSSMGLSVEISTPTVTEEGGAMEGATSKVHPLLVHRTPLHLPAARGAVLFLAISCKGNYTKPL